ncbi:MAG: hypothetical protein K0R43_2908 [Pseudoduganella sp.]|jgi:Tfp pilus assembly protein PilF|nr:hypothetical protein [Pseudoduganella sp.]
MKPIIRTALCAGAALLPALSAGPALAQPFVPRAGSEVLETLPRARTADGAAARLQPVPAQLRQRLAAAPRDAALAAAAAQGYIAHGRATADPRYFGYAQAALAPWWHEGAAPPAIRLLRATLLQANHRFDAAMRDLEAVTREEPSNAQAWLTLATLQVVRGAPEAALRSCARLSALASPLVSATCLANARAGAGQLAASERLLALAVARSAGEAPAVRSWSLTLLAELSARRGEWASAEARFRRALAEAPGDSYLLGAFADLLLDQGRHAQVLALLAPQRRSDGLLLRYALALKGQGGDGAALAAAIAELQSRFNAARRRGENIHQREQARFELALRGNARAALCLAQSNWRAQKEGADLRVLLEAAAVLRQPAAAREALAWRRRLGMEDAAIDALARKLEGGA